MKAEWMLGVIFEFPLKMAKVCLMLEKIQGGGLRAPRLAFQSCG
jgi:hypothetical protein